MRIDVKKLQFSDLGTSSVYQVENEPMEISDLTFTSPVNGEVKLTAGDDVIYAAGKLTATLQLECHRCLRAFERTATINLSGEFSPHPQDEQLPIEKGHIDLDPLIRQEFILSQPIKLVCEAECPGICPDCGERSEPGHSHEASENK